jgi:hypothetical protein
VTGVIPKAQVDSDQRASAQGAAPEVFFFAATQVSLIEAAARSPRLCQFAERADYQGIRSAPDRIRTCDLRFRRPIRRGRENSLPRAVSAQITLLTGGFRLSPLPKHSDRHRSRPLFALLGRAESGRPRARTATSSASTASSSTTTASTGTPGSTTPRSGGSRTSQRSGIRSTPTSTTSRSARSKTTG